MIETPANVKTHVREAIAVTSTKGLDATVAAVEEALVAAWLLERRGVLGTRDVPDVVDAVVSALKKIAPPPPKKIKFSDPLRKILPLAETSVKPAADVALLLLALTQVGDFTEQTDKKRKDFELFLDDWRRMTWESARVSDWKRFRELATKDERVMEGRLSRESALAVLEAIANRRTDYITPVPDVSMLACARCGGFRGRDRARCSTCKGTYCTKCLGPTADVCIADYAARYATIDPERRQRIAGDARAILKEFKLDPYSRNDTFVRALKERGVDVTFQDLASLEGVESNGPQGRVKFLLCDRQGPATKRALFGALARTSFRAAEVDIDPLATEYFVDLCLGLPIDDALKAR
ncbi:MAG TPA: hypothetical protein VJB14_01645 [Planctomycetota bacterium]|nr:hypothetical protein [Planctomycetota bacterium]